MFKIGNVMSLNLMDNRDDNWIDERVGGINYLSATPAECMRGFTIIIIIIIIIIIVYLNCIWVSARWQWYYNKTKHK
jgi:hypothetical protein